MILDIDCKYNRLERQFNFQGKVVNSVIYNTENTNEYSDISNNNDMITLIVNKPMIDGENKLIFDVVREQEQEQAIKEMNEKIGQFTIRLVYMENREVAMEFYSQLISWFSSKEFENELYTRGFLNEESAWSWDNNNNRKFAKLFYTCVHQAPGFAKNKTQNLVSKYNIKSDENDENKVGYPKYIDENNMQLYSNKNSLVLRGLEQSMSVFRDIKRNNKGRSSEKENYNNDRIQEYVYKITIDHDNLLDHFVHMETFMMAIIFAEKAKEMRGGRFSSKEEIVKYLKDNLDDLIMYIGLTNKQIIIGGLDLVSDNLLQVLDNVIINIIRKYSDFMMHEEYNKYKVKSIPSLFKDEQLYNDFLIYSDIIKQ